MGLCAYGTFACEMTRGEREFFALSVLYMVTTAFTAAKTYRDRLLGDLLLDVRATEAVVQALRGNDLWVLQVAVSFLVSMVFPFYTLITSVGNGDMTGDPGFAVNASIFALISTLGVAKAVRDKADASTLDRVLFDDERTKFFKILSVSRGSYGNMVVVIIGFLISFCSTMAGVAWTDGEVLSFDRKGFILIAALFTMYSAFICAKLVRDLGDPVLAADAHLPFRLLVFGAFGVANILGIGGVYAMPIPDPNKRFIINGLLFTVAQALSLAKLTRDQNETQKIMRQQGAAMGMPLKPLFPWSV
jgi:hypothetical protein